jgi:hypothetical protein
MSRIVFALSAAAILQGAPNLAVERMTLHQFEDGPVLPATYEFLPGETAHFSCRLKGFQVDKTEEENDRVKLSWSAEFLDPAGVPIDKPKSGRIEGRVAPEDKNWLPKFLVEFTVPPFAPSGEYRVSIRAKDEVSSGEIRSDLIFHVRGQDVESSDKLLTRNFRFLRAEDDPVGLRDPVYHPGDMLWARFDIVGYKFGENHKFWVDYGLAVLNAEGKQLFAQPEAAADSHEPFYPQRYVPGALSLSLDKNVSAGSYFLVVTVHDKVGEQSWEERESFRVE